MDAAEFGRVKVGDKAPFAPPVPECDPCTCHMFAWLIAGLVVGAVAVAAIVANFTGRVAMVLSFVAAGWIGIIVWARACCFERNKFLRDLEAEISFFETLDEE